MAAEVTPGAEQAPTMARPLRHRGRKRWPRAAIPFAVLAAWFAYLWFISGVLPSVEKYRNGQIKWAGYVKRESWGRYARQGHWVTYYENGQKESEGMYEAGRKTGTWEYWKLEGAPSTQPANVQPHESGGP